MLFPRRIRHDKMTTSVRLMRAIAAACRAEPALNAWYNSGAGARRLVKRIDIGIAIDTEGGLIVPVVRNEAHKLIEEGIARAKGK